MDFVLAKTWTSSGELAYAEWLSIIGVSGTVFDVGKIRNIRAYSS